MKKNIIYYIFGLLSFIIPVYGQSDNAFDPHGSPYMTVFFNYHTDWENITKIEIKRAYLGYKYHFSKEISAKTNIDVGMIEGKYVAYLKSAMLQYKKGKIKVKAGLIPTKQFKVQEKFWGYRYILKSMQDLYKFNASSDLGISLDYRLANNLSVDFIIQNGEGYKHIESTGTFRAGTGISWTPAEGLLLRIYSDYSGKPAVKRISYTGFAGYKYKKMFRIAAEYSYQEGTEFIADNKMKGFSVYGTYNFNEKWNVFGRIDRFSHDFPYPEGTSLINEEGTFGTGGFEYKPVKGVYISANYRAMISSSSLPYSRPLFYLNLAFKI